MSSLRAIAIYYIRNKFKVLSVALMLSLSVLGVTASAAIAGSILRDIDKHSQLFDHYYVVRVNPWSKQQVSESELEQALNDLNSLDYYIKGYQASTKTAAILGSIQERIFYMDTRDIPKFMQEMQWELTAGKLPAPTEFELILTQGVAKNKGVSLGDKIGNAVDKTDFLEGEHSVVGLVTAKTDFSGGIGDINQLKEIDRQMGASYYIKPKFGSREALRSDIEKLQTKYPELEVLTDQIVRELNDKEFATIRTLVWALDIIIMLVICGSVALLNIIFFMQRSREFGILSALGYTTGYLIWRTFWESLGVILVAWTGGILLAEGVYTLLNATTLEPMGIGGLTVLEPGTFVFSLPVPLAVTIFSTATIYWYLSRLDPIAIIEKRM